MSKLIKYTHKGQSVNKSVPERWLSNIKTPSAILLSTSHCLTMSLYMNECLHACMFVCLFVCMYARILSQIVDGFENEPTVLGLKR